jgi:hypothetical protein
VAALIVRWSSSEHEPVYGVMALLVAGHRGGLGEAMKAGDADKQRQYLSSSVLTNFR